MRPFRCRTPAHWLYTRHDFQGSADRSGRPRTAAVAVFRPANGGTSGTLIVRSFRTCANRFPFTLSKVNRVMKPRTLHDKIWNDHLVDEQPDGTCLLYID